MGPGEVVVPKYPIINFTMDDLKPGSESRFSTSKNVRKALEDFGFFVANQDEFIPMELGNALFQELEKLFSLPDEIKMRNTSETTFLFGYQKATATSPLSESLTIEGSTSLEAVRRFTHLMWPSGNINFCETVHLFAEKVSKLKQMVTILMLESYGVDKYYESHKESVFHGLRLMKYQPPRFNEPELGSGAHTDKDWLTVVVQQRHVNGLQIKPKNEEHWVSVDLSPGSVAVFAGDALTAWSNGRVHAAVHRVLMHGKEARYSVAQFEFLTKTVEAPPEFVDDDHPLLYKPFENIGLLKFYASPEGRSKADDLLNAYCGI